MWPNDERVRKIITRYIDLEIVSIETLTLRAARTEAARAGFSGVDEYLATLFQIRQMLQASAI